MVQRVDVQYVQYYTQGSAARRILPAAKTLISALPQIKKQKVHRIYIDPIAIVGTVVALCMLVMMAVGVSQLRDEQLQTAAIEEKVTQMRMENRQLQAEYAVRCDLDEVEKTALALGMIPQQDAVHISIEIDPVQTEETITLWQQIGTFLTGLFA